MVMWIPEYLRKNVTETNDDQTLYIDLPKNEQISHLQLELSAQGVATPRELTTLIDIIDHYEVVADGVKVIYNLEPEIAYYIDFLTNGGVYPNMSFNYTPNQRELHEFIIPFGRFPFDEEYMLDTSLYDNVQLRIKYKIDGTYFTSGTFRENIVMWRPLEKIRPVGLIRNRVVKKEVSSGSVETIEHELPMTYPLRYVGVRAEDIDQNITSNITAIKLNIDEGRLILVDQNINEIKDMDKKRFPEKTHYWVTAALSDQTMVKAHVDYPFPRSIVSSGVRALMYKLYNAVGEQVGLNIYEADGTAVSDTHAISLMVSGSNPHKCLTLFDGRKEALDVGKYTQGKVEYTMGAYECTLHTFVQEIVTGKLS